DLLTGIVLIVIFLGLGVLIFSKGYLKRNDLVYGAEALWYATLALALCLGVAVGSFNWRLKELQAENKEVRSHITEVWEYLDLFEQKSSGTPEVPTPATPDGKANPRPGHAPGAPGDDPAAFPERKGS